MGGVQQLPLPTSVAPGQTIDVAVNLVAPLAEGNYRGNWQLRNEAGEIFGTASTANRPFWVSIQVVGVPQQGTTYDFVANACSAKWFSGVGNLNCPGRDGDANGFVLKLTNPVLENGSAQNRPALLTVPQNVDNGYIRAVYPSYTVQEGDRFQAVIGCENKATACFVLFRVDYQMEGGFIREFWAFGERYEGSSFSVDLDLSSLAGQNVKFVLTILSIGQASNDRALWVEPRIVHFPVQPTATSTPRP
jgi:hypothetical protein